METNETKNPQIELNDLIVKRLNELTEICGNLAEICTMLTERIEALENES